MDRLREEPCTCGGTIAVAVPVHDEEVMRAVRRHQDTVTHRVWAQAGGLENDGPRRRDAYEDQLR